MSAGLDDLLCPTRTECGVEAASKKRLFEIIAEKISLSTSSLDNDHIYQQLLAREKLGTTGFGHGVAIPHCRVAGCQRPLGALLTLDRAVDYDAHDGEPVDLVFALVVPEAAAQEHLDILAELARRFSNPVYRDGLRSARNELELLSSALEILL